MAAALAAQTLSFLPAATDKAAWFKCGTSDCTHSRDNVRDRARTDARTDTLNCLPVARAADFCIN